MNDRSTGDGDIFIAVCASREGKLLHRTLAVLSDAMVEATLGGFRCETVVLLHDADEATATMAYDRAGSSIRVVDLGGADRIKARNAAARMAEAPLITWIDAGDVCSRDWIREAAGRAFEAGREVVWHPEHCVVLGDSFQLVVCRDQEDAPREVASFFWTPPYPYAALAQRDLYQRFPLLPHDTGRGYLGGDWYWGCETIAAGIPHKTVPKTFVGILPDDPPVRINLGPAPRNMRPAPLRRA
ncbi:MAG: glycosyltransferase [Rhizobiaceae bacterium]|nr:glycosyltransferase [Rhizobiaceae bacterium]